MPYKLNPFTKKLDYYEPAIASGGSGFISNLSLIFCESFTGDGGTVEFTLNGVLENAAFEIGSWSPSRINSAQPVHATNDANAALYTSTNIFTKSRIQVDSISSATGTIVLTEPPAFLSEFKVWYWYTLNKTDVLSYYRREEFVASMESDASSGSSLPAQDVALNTAGFHGILSSNEDTVQKAMDLIDDHEHGTMITDTEIDDIDLVSFYVGYSTNGGLTSEPVWQIRKTVETGDEIDFYYADGSEDFDKIWDDRLSYTYN